LGLEETAKKVWLDTIKLHLSAPETRLASSVSAVEIFVSLFYGRVLNFNSQQPFSEDRDRLIVSKGHGSICMYPILADLGFFPHAELSRVGRKGGILGAIPDPIIPGYETVNGSLGHGVGVGAGIATALRLKASPRSVFVVTGDGELHEGANWEAFMFAAHNRLENLNVIVDNNKISMLDHTNRIVDHRSLAAKFRAFGWICYEADGHDVGSVTDTLLKMKETCKGAPKVLIANTIKGRGIEGLENVSLSHVLNPNPIVAAKILGDES
jgi:transketolase